VEQEIEPGKYVLAVSGGVDSMVLLDLLANKSGIELVVAHFNHGIRGDSGIDEALVRRRAKQLGLPFESGSGNLGAGTSEEMAREARYDFLEKAVKKHKAAAIITAHHQDDLIETAFINLIRGTGRKGLVAISGNKKIIRPLLKCPKQEIVEYAQKHGIKWREDSSNQDMGYLRNYVRKNLMPGLNKGQRKEILENIDKVAKNDAEIHSLIANLSQSIYKNEYIDRSAFASLPVSLSEELLIRWLKQKNVRDYDKKTISRLNVSIRTAKANTVCEIQGNLKLAIGPKKAEFSHTS
jgi:tRNA(Ile)-lysidine synthase